MQPLIGILHANLASNGFYAKGRLAQKKEVIRWFGDKNNVEICFVPTSKEDETTNLGCATVFLEILENAGLINIDRKKFVISGEEKEKIVVTTVVEASKK